MRMHYASDFATIKSNTTDSQHRQNAEVLQVYKLIKLIQIILTTNIMLELKCKYNLTCVWKISAIDVQLPQYLCLCMFCKNAGGINFHLLHLLVQAFQFLFIFFNTIFNIFNLCYGLFRISEIFNHITKSNQLFKTILGRNNKLDVCFVLLKLNYHRYHLLAASVPVNNNLCGTRHRDQTPQAFLSL